MKSSSTTLLLIFTFLMIIMPVSAFLGSYEQNNCVEILTISNSSAVNISTVSSPEEIFVLNAPMDQNGQTFNYTFCNTTELGYYNYDYYDAEGEVYVNNFLITVSGKELTVGVAIMYIALLMGLLFFFLLCLYGAMAMNGANNRENGRVVSINYKKHVKLLLFVACYIFILFIAGFLRSISASYLLFDNASVYFNYAYWILFSAMWPIIVASSIISFINWVDDKKLLTAVNRGVPMR